MAPGVKVTLCRMDGTPYPRHDASDGSLYFNVEEKDEFFVQVNVFGLENFGDPLACLSYVDGEQASRCIIQPNGNSSRTFKFGADTGERSHVAFVPASDVSTEPGEDEGEEGSGRGCIDVFLHRISVRPTVNPTLASRKFEATTDGVSGKAKDDGLRATLGSTTVPISYANVQIDKIYECLKRVTVKYASDFMLVVKGVIVSGVEKEEKKPQMVRVEKRKVECIDLT